MSDNSKKTKKISKSQKDLGKKVTDEWKKFAKNTPDIKKEIEDIITSVEEEKDTNSSNQATSRYVQDVYFEVAWFEEFFPTHQNPHQ